MKAHPAATFVFLALATFLGGCASFDAEVETRRALAGVERYYIVSNLNDNHALDSEIAAAFKRHGYEATFGPITMMPLKVQAIVTYSERWDWDFGDHLLYLQLTVHENRISNQLLGSATFSARIPLHETTTLTVGRLVDRLFDKHTAPRPSDSAPPAEDPATTPKKRSR